MNAWHVTRWFNTPQPIDLQSLRGRVVAVEAFQMLCPGCVAYGLPQATRLREVFAENDLAVIGLHCVFEHHEAMTPAALAAFIHEYRLEFPIAIDEPSADGPLPRTMRAWNLGGTPSLVLFDREGHERFRHLGRIDDMALGALVARLVASSAAAAPG